MNSKAQLRARWQTADGRSTLKAVAKALKKGRMPNADIGLGNVGGKVDLRGIPLPKAEMSEVALQNLDLSYGELSNAWIERSIFKNVAFDNADLSGFADHGNSFEDVSFVATDFRGAGLGYQGSKYGKCRFEKCKFKDAVFIRAEFEESLFKNCDLDGVDFNVSSFERCKFVGKLDDVRFRGDYAFAKDRAKFGDFKNNRMDQVDFSDAILSWLAITDGVPVNRVILPDDPHIFTLDRLDEVVQLANKQVRDKFSGKDLEAAELFFHVQLQYAPHQKEGVVNLHDYAASGTSDSFLGDLKDLLTTTRRRLG